MIDLEALFGQSESREDAPGVWTHTFTPPYWKVTETFVNREAADIMRAICTQYDLSPEMIIVRPAYRHKLIRLRAQGKRTHRMQLRKRRQRRARQRKHHQGR